MVLTIFADLCDDVAQMLWWCSLVCGVCAALAALDPSDSKTSRKRIHKKGNNQKVEKSGKSGPKKSDITSW